MHAVVLTVAEAINGERFPLTMPLCIISFN
jgi:hypothetical protein